METVTTTIARNSKLNEFFVDQLKRYVLSRKEIGKNIAEAKGVYNKTISCVRQKRLLNPGEWKDW